MTSLVNIDEERKLTVHQYGEHPPRYVFFPGFGCPGSVIGNQVSKELPVLGVDLPFIGPNWQRQDYRVEDILAVLRQLSFDYDLSNIHLLGHSLGARVIIKTLPKLIGQTPTLRGLTLIAPDGMGGRYTSWLDQLPSFAFPVMEHFLNRPKGLIQMADWLRKRRLIDAFSYQYLRHHLRDANYRRLLTGTLRSLPFFRLGKEEYEALSAAPNVKILLGKEDPIIRRERIYTKVRDLKGLEIIEFKGGHVLPRDLLKKILG